MNFFLRKIAFVYVFVQCFDLPVGPFLETGVTLNDLSLTGVEARLVLALPPPLRFPPSLEANGVF